MFCYAFFLNHELQLANNTYSLFYDIAKENYVYKIWIIMTYEKMQKCCVFSVHYRPSGNTFIKAIFDFARTCSFIHNLLLMQTFFNYLPTILRILKHFTKNEEKLCGKRIINNLQKYVYRV